MKKILITKVYCGRDEDSYSDIVNVPATDTWMEVSEDDYWLLRKHLDRNYRIIEDCTFKLQEFLDKAKEAERLAHERHLAAEEKKKKTSATRRKKQIEKKKKQLEALKKELGVE